MRHTDLTGLLVVVGVLTAATVLGWWWRRRDGRIRPVVADDRPVDSNSEPASSALAALGVRPGAVTLVQFSSDFCAPCRATRRLLTDIEGRVDGIHVVEIDAERHLDEVRELAIWRTPTVLVVDTEARIVQRVSGVPDRDELITALRPLLAGAAR
ncbi:TlpA family protein disulfide reductase [Micromonospora sp. LH3U1]|uniref:TlpA family protein disulfide reductase n=1 Tax=Micromonospora sp. LH3U1 TaxID=3018339 RepID=UPI002349C5C1|nr:thioredoxin family protein [Micromonospora sp. LH3U1]WCN84037.1 thioredoxin family protein [Micromonospora sp. LH3U1]